MFLVDGNKFGLEIGRNPVGEFLYGVYTGGFQQFGELPCHTFDAEQVGMVCPFQDEF